MLKYYKQKTKLSNLNNFIQKRQVKLDVGAYKQIEVDSNIFTTTKREENHIDCLIQDQLRTLYHSILMVLDKLYYVEKVGTLKFNSSDEAKNYILLALLSKNSFTERFALYGNLNIGNNFGYDCYCGFPAVGNSDEEQFYNDGIISGYTKSIDDLDNGIIVERADIWNGIILMYYKNLALLEMKVKRNILNNRIKNV